MKTKTIPDEPILIGELMRRRPIAQTLARVESEYKCSSSESATSPQIGRSEGFFLPFCNHKIFLPLSDE
jgi:hypothetical protein